MMEDISEFIKKIEFEIDEIEEGTLKPETRYRDLEDWSSMLGLIFIALIDTEYDITINGEELVNCETIQELYDAVKNKM